MHFPLVAFYVALCMSLFSIGADMDGTKPAHWLIAAGALAFAVTGAFGLYHLTEKHTEPVLKALFARKPKIAPAHQR